MAVKLAINKPLSITEVYDLTAIAMGFNPNEVKRSDCTKIEVAESIFNWVEQFYKAAYHENYKQQLGMDWGCYGPKCNTDLADGLVRTEEGFISFEDQPVEIADTM